MLNSDDILQMNVDLDGLIGENRVMVELRRGSTSLAAQGVRIVRAGPRGEPKVGNGTRATKAAVIVVGPSSLDVERGDRFSVNGILFEVVFIRPSRLVGTLAEAEAVE